MWKQILILLLLVVILATRTVVEAGSGIPLPEPALSVQNSELVSDIPQANLKLTAQDWWDDAVFYEIFVRSFYDSNCDGIGDFNGINQKLDYLQALGVNAIWLMPINPSPSYHGYDIVNYYAVNHEYGSMENFKRLLDEIHRRDMHLIVDLVLNHTSSAHPFFVDANNNLNSPYRDWYIWSETDPGNGWHPGGQGYYYGFFWSGMPDLNYTNPEVTAQMDNVVRYWLDDIGVDGFRVDAAKHLIEDGAQRENTPATHDWYKEFFVAYKTDHPDAYTVGEVYGAGGFIAKTYTGQLDHVFNFELASGFVNSANGRSNTGVKSAYTLTLKDMPQGNYATFLTNHDQNRAMSVFNGDLGKAKAAASLLLTAPGTPFIYYGEEIGMQGKKPDEDIRLPMQWSADPQAGFTCLPTGDSDSAQVWRAPNEDYPTVNVAYQLDDGDSLLQHYQALIALRSAHPALRIGSTSLIATDSTALFAALRTTDAEQILVLVNLSDQPLSEFALSAEDSPLAAGEYQLESLLGNLAFSLIVEENGAFDLNLLLDVPIQPNQTFILRFE
ncbi:MAG: DUF3459 domain-containing protein [Anaerolineae bacterium]|nr:DUF3459 domain-containing protein [Anaerolineae bacterium]